MKEVGGRQSITIKLRQKTLKNKSEPGGHVKRNKDRGVT